MELSAYHSSSCAAVLNFLSVLLLISVQNVPTCSSYNLPSPVQYSMMQHYNQTAISSFRVLNRRFLGECPKPDRYLKITATASNSADLSDDDVINVTITGVVKPDPGHWVAMISPSNSNVEPCISTKIDYAQVGDYSTHLPLLCHYPVKAIYVKSDTGYLSCQKKEYKGGGDRTCSATLSFHVVNIRTDIQFVFFGGSYEYPCFLARSNTLKFANPNKPLHGHISSTDSTATSMRVRWVSGDKQPQELQYGDGKTKTSTVSTFTQKDMCSFLLLPSPAKDFGWHDPGFIHSAVMTGLTPSSTFSYKYGSDSVGWSDSIKFKTPPAGGSDELKFLIIGDMGKGTLDDSDEHYKQPGALAVINAMTEEVEAGNVDSIFHIGDISYATGFLVEWDFFLHLITTMASRVPYMTAIGNHERVYTLSGSKYDFTDSGGECGVPYETYFPMPTAGRDKPWYSIEQGSIHFTVISTENQWKKGSEQYQWIQKDLASVNRTRTPWLIFTGHRPMYTSGTDFGDLPGDLSKELEPLLLEKKVDVAIFAHVHNYERTCCIIANNCAAMPEKDQNRIDTYNLSNYRAPVHAIVGMAGFTLEKFSKDPPKWSLQRFLEYGYVRCHATRNELKFQFVNATTKHVRDTFRIIKHEQNDHPMFASE